MMNLNRSKSDLFHRRKVHQERELDSLPIKGSSMNSHEKYIFGKQLKSRNNLDPQNKSIKRAELLSQLPSSTKVSTVLVVEPTSSFPIKNKVLPNTIIDSLQSTGENILEDETTDIFSYTSKVSFTRRKISDLMYLFLYPTPNCNIYKFCLTGRCFWSSNMWSRNEYF